MKINNPHKVASRKLLEDEILLYNNGNRNENSNTLNQRIREHNSKFNDHISNPKFYFGNAFQGCTAFNQDISSWNTTNIINIGNMFKNLK